LIFLSPTDLGQLIIPQLHLLSQSDEGWVVRVRPIFGADAPRRGFAGEGRISFSGVLVE
jgi:hypothetical protein